MISLLGAVHALDLFVLAGGRWTVPVLASLRSGTLRFGEIRRSLGGFSQKQLAHTLRHLERDGSGRRTAYATIPPRVEYHLTDLGAALVLPLSEVGRFAVERGREIDAARERFDERTASILAANIRRFENGDPVHHIVDRSLGH